MANFLNPVITSTIKQRTPAETRKKMPVVPIKMADGRKSLSVKESRKSAILPVGARDTGINIYTVKLLLEYR